MASLLSLARGLKDKTPTGNKTNQVESSDEDDDSEQDDDSDTDSPSASSASDSDAESAHGWATRIRARRVSMDPSWGSAGGKSKDDAPPPKERDYLYIPARRCTTVLPKNESADLISMLRGRFTIAKGRTEEDEQDSLSTTKILQRESNRFHPEVVRWLQMLWVLCDVDRSGDIDVDEYTEIYRVVYATVTKDATLTADEVGALAAEEHLRDTRGGTRAMLRPTFFQSFYEIADSWTASTSVRGCAAVQLDCVV